MEYDLTDGSFPKTEIDFTLTVTVCTLDKMVAPSPVSIVYQAATKLRDFTLPNFSSANGCEHFFVNSLVQVERTDESVGSIVGQEAINSVQEFDWIPPFILNFDPVSNKITVYSRSSLPDGELFRFKITG